MGQVTWLKCPGHCVLTISVVYRLLQVKMDHRGLFNRPDNLINQGTAIILLHQAKFQVHSYTVYSLDTIHSYMTVKNYIIHFFSDLTHIQYVTYLNTFCQFMGLLKTFSQIQSWTILTLIFNSGTLHLLNISLKIYSLFIIICLSFL